MSVESKEFELLVKSIIELSGYTVIDENLINSQKVDLYFEEKTLTGNRRTAVECKKYEAKLDKQDIAKIHSLYLPLIEGKFIDQVLIVTMNGLMPSAYTYIDSISSLAHYTVSQLQSSILDFKPYLKGLLVELKKEPVFEYYISLKSKDKKDIEDYILKDWLIRQDIQPLAVLGSYGQGKSTLAKKLALQLCEQAINDPLAKIPILIKLGDISSEQSLEGLLGKLFTANTIVRNYTFQAFMALNNSGRFVIILDGFDEMKQVLSWWSFKFNLNELNRLVVERSKVILLGRPTAFMNDAEYLFALHGQRMFGSQLIKEDNWPDYEEIEIDSFDRGQINLFLNLYTKYKKQELLLTKFNRFLEDKHIREIASRPVQLKMMVEVLPQYHGDISSLTTSILYSEFIDLIIERELGKNSRLRFNNVERRSFARMLAWWLWKNKREQKLIASLIPDDIINNFAEDGEDPEIIRRDLVSACFLERKLGETLHFPHRSFQEFLVAEEILLGIKEKNITAEEILHNGTHEIFDFMSECISKNELIELDKILESYSGIIPLSLAKIFYEKTDYEKFIRSRGLERMNKWQLYFMALRIYYFKDSTFQNTYMNSIWSIMLSKYPLLALYCGMIVSEKTEIGDFIINFFSRSIERYRSELKLSKQRTNLDRPPWLQKLLNGFRFNERNRTIDISNLYNYLYQNLKKDCLISEHSFEERVSFPTSIGKVTIANKELFLDFFKIRDI